MNFFQFILDDQDAGVLFLAALAPQMNFSFPGTKTNLYQVKIITLVSHSGSTSLQQYKSACTNFR